MPGSQGTLFEAKAIDRFQLWLEDVKGPRWSWYVKRLAGNDTKLTGGNQAGPYVSKDVIFRLFPSLTRAADPNPRVEFPVWIVSHSQPEQTVRAIWYNRKTRDECRVTGWGGQKSPLLDPEATGSLCIFAFLRDSGRDANGCRVWLCSTVAEEDHYERSYGPVEPSRWQFTEHASVGAPNSDADAVVSVAQPVQPYLAFDSRKLPFPSYWLKRFPSGEELVDEILRLYPEYAALDVGKRLIKRRDAEFVCFRALEEAVVLPSVKDGFATVDAFVDFANSVTNRRKSRSGKSLELHMIRILEEEGISGFAHDQETENGKRPDFLFPGVAAYRNPSFPDTKLRMLAVKTTCKDRWRQVLDEAERIRVKHLLTLQEGVSEKQFEQMQKADLRLVVPKPLIKKYPDSIRAHLVALSHFIGEVKSLSE